MEFPKTDIGGVESGAKNQPRIEDQGLPEEQQGLPEPNRRGNQWPPPFWPKKQRFRAIGPEPFAYWLGAPILMAMTVHFPFQNTYAALPANFFVRVAPTPVAAPRLIKLNRPLAILLGEVIDADGVRRDIQLKGSGPTPFSRRGDGRAALGPVLREYIVSEAM